MQTFLPYPSFAETAAVLDRQRLGKQRVETLQILKAITTGTGWAHHPATKMWQATPGSLIQYGVAICAEWIKRGYKDTCRDKILAFGSPDGPDPAWLGNPAFHASHRAALLFKNPAWYIQFGWIETPEVNYIWPGENY